MTPAESLVVVQRSFLDVMNERDAALALLQDARPFVHDVSLYNFGARGVAAFAVLQRIDAALGGDHADR